MGYRHDMHGKTSQQQEIVRQRDEEERRKTEAFEKQKKENALKELTFEKAGNNGDYKSIKVLNGQKDLLELRVSGTAISNQPCGLKDIDIYEWLFNIAKTFALEVKEFKILMITSYDINEKRLNKSWKKLKVESK
jgi:hypothetical protein